MYTHIHIHILLDKVHANYLFILSFILILFQNVSYDLTKGYLDLVTNYVTLMILLSRVEDRKAVLGLFNAAHEMVNNQGYEVYSFPHIVIFLTCCCGYHKDNLRMSLLPPFFLLKSYYSHRDPSFPRLGQMIMDYETPLRKLNEEFVPHAKLLSVALSSLWVLYPRRNLRADQWRLGRSHFSSPNRIVLEKADVVIKR